MKSAYNSNLEITDSQGVVTVLAYRTGFHFGGHTHLAFEYNESYGHAGKTRYRHVVFHLVALSGDQNCKGTGATVLKQVPVGPDKYGFVGGPNALAKAKQLTARANRKNHTNKVIRQEDEYKYGLRPLDDTERNLPNDTSWTTKKFRSRSISIPTFRVKAGRLLCRKLSRGESENGIESSRFHKLDRNKGTNCVQFAMQILNKMHIQPNWVFKFHSKFSPPEAIKLGRLNYIIPRV